MSPRLVEGGKEKKLKRREEEEEVAAPSLSLLLLGLLRTLVKDVNVSRNIRKNAGARSKVRRASERAARMHAQSRPHRARRAPHPFPPLSFSLFYLYYYFYYSSCLHFTAALLLCAPLASARPSSLLFYNNNNT